MFDKFNLKKITISLLLVVSFTAGIGVWLRENVAPHVLAVQSEMEQMLGSTSVLSQISPPDKLTYLDAKISREEKSKAQELEMKALQRGIDLKLDAGSSIEKRIAQWFLSEDSKNNEIKEKLVSNNASFKYINFAYIESNKDAQMSLSLFDKSSLYREQKKISLMQKTALFIQDTYEVPLTRAEKIVLHVYKNSQLHDIPASLIFGIIAAESTFKLGQVSVANARGLMQVIDKYHPQEKGSVLERYNSIDGLESSIDLGVMVFKKYLAKTGYNVEKALLLYNGSSDDSTKKYAKKVFKFQTGFNLVDPKLGMTPSLNQNLKLKVR